MWFFPGLPSKWQNQDSNPSMILEALFLLLYYAFLLFSSNCVCPLAQSAVYEGVSCQMVLTDHWVVFLCLGEWLQCSSVQPTVLPTLVPSEWPISEETFWKPVEQDRSSKTFIWKSIFSTLTLRVCFRYLQEEIQEGSPLNARNITSLFSETGHRRKGLFIDKEGWSKIMG